MQNMIIVCLIRFLFAYFHLFMFMVNLIELRDAATNSI